MFRFSIFIFLLLFSLGFSQNNSDDSYSSQAQYEHILSFDSQVEVAKDASITVLEKIKVYAAGQEIRRGIFRSLPVWRNLNGSKQRVKYNIISVKKNGEKEKYHTKTENSNLVLYMGDEDSFLTPGIYDYEIKYETKDQIGFFSTYDELYWNVNGTLWDFPVDNIKVSVNLPEGANIIQESCYTGSYGSNSSNCQSKSLSGTSAEWSAKNLNKNEGLTIAVGFKNGVIIQPAPPGFLERNWINGLLLIAFLGLTFYFYNSWQKYGIDPEKPIVYPQFSSPNNLSPASVGYLEKGFYHNNYITAAIVSLATKGYLKIVEVDERLFGVFGNKKFTIIKLKEPDQTLPKEEINLMNTLLGGGKPEITFDGSYSSKIEKAVTDFKASLSFQHDKLLNEGNQSGKVILPLLIIAALYSLGIYVSYQQTYHEEFLIAGVAFGILTIVTTVFAMYFFERYKIIQWLFGAVSIGLFLILISVILNDSERKIYMGFYSSFLFLLFGFVSTVLFFYLIKKPSVEKLEIQSLISGFKMYLGTAEEKTLQFHNPPKMTPEVFEKMLPFAMVLGVDQIWGDKFQKMLKSASIAADGYHSAWYVGNSPMNYSFANTLSSSLSQSIASSATQPSSSGSGSGGGGFSGGGGGGGGGGGW